MHQKQCEFLRDGVSNGKKAAIIKIYLDLGMDATVKKYFPSLSAAQQKNKKRQIYKWMKKDRFFERGGSAHLQRIRAVGLTIVLSDDDEDFIAHWIRDLRREGVPYRLSLRRKTRIDQITPANSEKVAQEFRLEVLKTIEEGIVEIYNADQTAMNYEYLPSRTYDTKGTRTVWIHTTGAEKKNDSDVIK
ncbi:hypothetical protein PHPALM_9502 [Phytophthora palmivora]|uniref:HTH CENPB-type domain-containing protein n=1 Tax=Phytophthora palmivora TaxID=4796 RepID=A0A2P4Y745_9STRA|nr:hypothetical protein PHPALM_9502 [Phytophthora palmivora]